MILNSQSESRKRWSSNVLACDNIGRSLGGLDTFFWGGVGGIQFLPKRFLDKTLYKNTSTIWQVYVRVPIGIKFEFEYKMMYGRYKSL